MRGILKGKWLVLLIWLAALGILWFASPDMGELVREKGQITVPDGYSSAVAKDILNEVLEQEGKGGQKSAVLVFHRESGLAASDRQEIEETLQRLKEEQGRLGLAEIISPFEDSDLEERLISADGTTVLVPVTFEEQGKSVREIRATFNQALEQVSVEHYLTGGWLIDEDMIVSAQEGLKKTEGITVVFILVVMLIVFRSPVAPLVPLVTVGITYLVSQSIVAFLVDLLHFPLSNFTQIFLVAVLFGIGTDYCILLLSRFKEELIRQDNRTEAVAATYRTAGKTVLYSGLAVMIGFATVGLSTFQLYQSAVAVAVGVAILLLALNTLVPVFMGLMAPRLFWPVRGQLEHRPSKLWDAAGRFALARPLIALAVVALITAPVLLTYDGQISFDLTEEIGDGYPSVKGFHIISERFGPGEAMPVQVVLRHHAPLDGPDHLVLLEKISRELAKVDGVEQVRSVTRPLGEPVEGFLVAQQAATLQEGLEQGRNGIEEISSGLGEANAQLAAAKPELQEATRGIQELVSGTEEIQVGLNQLHNGLAQLAQGADSGASGAEEIRQGLVEMKANARQLQKGAEQLLQGYQTAEESLASVAEQYRQLQAGLARLVEQLSQVHQSLQRVEERHPQLQQDEEYQQTKQATAVLLQQGQQLAAGLEQLNAALAQIKTGLTEANAVLSGVAGGQQALLAGLDQLITALEELEDGLNELADGQQQITGQLPSLSGGLDRVNKGQQELLLGFEQLGGQVDALISGLDQSTAGLHQVADGLAQAEHYLAELSAVVDEEMAGWHVPQEVLDSAEFQQALEAYLSADQRIATFDVILADNPYAIQALAMIPQLEEAVQRAVKDTELEGAQLAVGGVTSTYADLYHISSEDYARTVVLMLLGIALILVVVLRSLVMPIYLIASLVLTYYTSMAVTELIFVNALGYSGINWAVSFFAYVMLISLGIDYSIFLMNRFNEYRHLSVKEGILLAMGNMGTVIISAAVILGGTFAAMYPSGVLSLMQIATIVLTGLFLYALVVLPLFVPVMVRMFGQANFWPFKETPSASEEQQVL
ncbi:MMPL family transporter [Caldalkalibacillus thermarum TA2.A1]|uniref:MMPL family transporter n=1 Tax=Caldalkalibacillus thermarum (strain TA2.A1) TaxID=986075 RepID=A0A8X8I9C7_CALTT|nr:MMPL family transporter [Caldalkalibacillus thermarum]QZT34081.1 MMPL family transporter [Caldalkalibacillus thermarum TA2.A1]